MRWTGCAPASHHWKGRAGPTDPKSTQEFRERSGRSSMNREAFNNLLSLGVRKGASDIHFEAGYPPVYRIHGDLLSARLDRLSAEDTRAIAGWSSSTSGRSGSAVPLDLRRSRPQLLGHRALPLPRQHPAPARQLGGGDAGHPLRGPQLPAAQSAAGGPDRRRRAAGAGAGHGRHRRGQVQHHRGDAGAHEPVPTGCTSSPSRTPSSSCSGTASRC